MVQQKKEKRSGSKKKKSTTLYCTSGERREGMHEHKNVGQKGIPDVLKLEWNITGLLSSSSLSLNILVLVSKSLYCNV